MEPTESALVEVFQALDTDGKGYITVDQFTSTFREFYESTGNRGRKTSTSLCNIDRIVHVLDPENDGIIHFADFKRAFQGDLDDLDTVLDETQDGSSNTNNLSFSPESVTNKSGCFSDGLENKTDDSGIITHDTSILDCDNDSNLSIDGGNSSRLQRDTTRRSWPKHRGDSYLGSQNPDSPTSASRSEIIMDDMETNFEMIRDQMRRMEERVETINTSRQHGTESRIDRLRDENARMTAQVTILEERLKEAEERARRNVEAERQHLQTIMTRNSREHTTEVETLRARIATIETECTDLRVESTRIKAAKEASVMDRRRNSEALTDSQEQVRALQIELSTLEEKHKKEMEILRHDRDHAVRVLEELNGSISGRRRSRVSSQSITGGSEIMARYQETQEIVRRLISENKSLRQQLEDAQDQLFARSLEEGRSLVGPTEKSWAAEIDNCTKEEVVELWTKEKNINEQLRRYIDNLITRIIERHPSLLEIAGSSPST